MTSASGDGIFPCVPRTGLFRALLTVVVMALVAATSASSRPAAGITISAEEPIAAITGFADPNGFYQASVIVAARFNPEAVRDSVRVTFVNTKPGGAGSSPFTGSDTDSGLRSISVYQNELVAVYQGSRLLITAKWNAYNVGGGDGQATATGILQVKKKEPAPRYSWQRKQQASRWARAAYANCAVAMIAAAGALAGVISAPFAFVAGVAAGMSCRLGSRWDQIARDPVDLNFRAIAKPKTPPVPKVAAGEGVPAAAAAGFNKLFALQAKEIGLSGAIVTSFNRSQGAHVKKQTAWEKKQVLAAGKYAAQLSALMLAEAKLRPSVRRAFSEPLEISEDEAYDFQSSLITRASLPAALAKNLAKLGVTKAELSEIRAQLIAGTHPTRYAGDVIAKIADPQDLALMRKVAADLKAFARDAARDPLTTGQ